MNFQVKRGSLDRRGRADLCGNDTVDDAEHLAHDVRAGISVPRLPTFWWVYCQRIDNAPVMFAVLTMNPQMPDGQWLLVTMTTGIGGNLMSIGSAVGVALMGQARGIYTFFNHLKWTPAIALGYGLSIWVHMYEGG